MPVLLSPPYLQFLDDNGIPLAGGLIYTYAAGTTTPKATYTDAGGLTQATNPIVLDAYGRATVWIQGSYKVIVKTAAGVTIRTTDNVTSFTAATAADASFFNSFSGTGSQTVFTLSADLGTDENSIQVFINKNLQSCVTNGAFATDTDWTKGAGWTIAAGVATATGAISTAISQTSPVTYVQGQAYSTTYTVTAVSAGGVSISIGGTTGTNRTATGTYNEVIIAGATQTTAFTGAGFTGSFDNVSINVASTAGFDIINPSAYTLNGTSLTFAVAPPAGASNIFVFAPSLAAGAASISAAAADASATAAGNAALAAATSAASAAAYAAAKVKWTFSSTTTMADPGTGLIRFNNATFSSVTAAAISNLSADSGNPDLSAWVATWDDAPSSPRGALFIFKDNANFAIFTITGANTNNSGWKQLALTHTASTGSFANTDPLLIGFVAYGSTTVTGGITALTGDGSASGSGSQPLTLATVNSNVGSFTAANITVDAKGRITAAANGSAGVVVQIGATQTASGSASIDFTSGIDGTYKKYILDYFNVTPATDGASGRIRFQQGGSFISSANYADMTAYVDTGNGLISLANDGRTSHQLLPQDNAVASIGAGTVEFYQPSVSAHLCGLSRQIVMQTDGSTARHLWGGFRLKLAAVTTGIQFSMDSGNIATGTFKLYGVT